jgi:hypothetical protein
VILGIIKKMPTGGGYSASSESIQKLKSAIKKDSDHLSVNPAIAKPSFCSSATYLVFISALEDLFDRKQIQFGPGIADKLLVTGQQDGVGVWGRWNANGPGTARLFAELHLGHNFASIEQRNCFSLVSSLLSESMQSGSALSRMSIWRRC